MRTVVFLAILVICISCNKNLDSKWDIDVLIPLAHAQLDFEDLIADSLVNTNPDNSLTLVYSSDDLKLNLDTLADLPETSTLDYFTIPFSSIDFAAGATFPTPLEELALNIADVELREMIIKKGKIGVSIKNYIEDPLVSTFQIVSSSLNGQPLVVNEIIPAGQVDAPGIFYSEYDVSGYTFDLTGENGDEFNTIVSDLDVIIDPNGNGVTITNTDSLVIETTYLGIEAEYVKGNFGQEDFSLENESVEINFFNDLNPEFLDLTNPKFNISLINGVGAEFRLTLKELISTDQSIGNSVYLEHELINNTINVNRAIDNGYPVPYQVDYTIDVANSNIEEWLENIPDQIQYSLQAELNPLGNISGGNDFIYCGSEIGFDLNLEIPLCISGQEISLSDTLTIDLDEEDNIENVQTGFLRALIENTFPFEGNIQLYILENQIITDSIFFETGINGSPQGVFPSVNPVSSVLVAEVTQEKFNHLKLADALVIEATLNTVGSGPVKFYNDQKIDLSLVLEANYLVNTE